MAIIKRRLGLLKWPLMLVSVPVSWWALTLVFDEHAGFVMVFLLMHEGGHAIGAVLSGQRLTGFGGVPFIVTFVSTAGPPNRHTITAGLFGGLASIALFPFVSDPRWCAAFAVSATAMNCAPVFGLDGAKLWKMQRSPILAGKMAGCALAMSGFLAPRSMSLPMALLGVVAIGVWVGILFSTADVPIAETPRLNNRRVS